MLKVRSSFFFEHLTAFPKPENSNTEKEPSCGNDLAVLNPKKFGESENALMDLQSKMSKLEISAQTTGRERAAAEEIASFLSDG